MSKLDLVRALWFRDLTQRCLAYEQCSKRRDFLPHLRRDCFRNGSILVRSNGLKPTFLVTYSNG